MFPTIPYAITYGPAIADWIFGHRKELGEIYRSTLEPILDAIGSGTTIARIGPVLTAIREDQSQVIALLHHHTHQLHDLTAATAQVADGVGVLTVLSSVGLGISALSQVHMAWQFHRLSKWLERIETQVQELKEIQFAALQGALQAGLGQFKSAREVKSNDPVLSRELLGYASHSLTHSSAKYLELLKGSVGQKSRLVKSAFAQFLMLSTLGDVAVKLEQGQPNLAIQALQQIRGGLIRHARSVWERTIFQQSARFLAPGLAVHGITLETVTELFRQAYHAQVVDKHQNITSAELFELLRDQMGSATDPFFYATSELQTRRNAFYEARDAVEQVNQVQGLILLIQNYHRPDRSLSELAGHVQRLIEARQPQDGDGFAVFAEPNATPSTVADS